MGKKHTVAIVDDSHRDRVLLTYLFKRNKNFTLLFEARNGFELLELQKIHDPDIIILDSKMPLMNGLDTLDHLHKLGCSHKVIFTSNGYEAGLFSRLEAKKVRVCCRKIPELIMKGAELLVNSTHGKWYDEGYGMPEEVHFKDDSIGLTAFEVRLVNLLAQGLTDKEIAHALVSYSAETIETYIRKLKRKLNIKTRSQLTAYFYMHGLITTFKELTAIPNPRLY